MSWRKKKIKFKKKYSGDISSSYFRKNTSQTQFSNILKSLKKLKDTLIIFTETSSDSYGNIINKMIKNFVLRNKNLLVALNQWVN